MESLINIEDPVEILNAIATHILSNYADETIEDWQVKLLGHELQSESPDWELLSQYWVPGIQIVESAFAQIKGTITPDSRDRLTAISFFILIDHMGTYSRHFVPENQIWSGPKLEPTQMASQLVSIFVNGTQPRPN
jgi:hypothetical protein